jgi:hypothetical protein
MNQPSQILFRVLIPAIISLVASSGLFAQQQRSAVPTQLQERWDASYSEEDATGQSVVALWSFDGEDSGIDSSGNGHNGELQGAKIVREGRFGACLESFAGFPVIDQRHAMLVKSSPDLTPAGAFTLEMWISPGAKIKDYPGAVLMDKKYVPYAHTDYILSIERSNSHGQRLLKIELGFGLKSVSWFSQRVNFEIGKWYHIAFTYDGAGTGEFFINGQLRGSRTEDGVGSLAPGKRGLSIGDRCGSNYRGFPGRIDQVRIVSRVLEFRPVRIERTSDRQTFVRMEKDVALKFRVTNLKRQPLSKAQIIMAIDTQSPRHVVVDELASGGSREISFPLDTRMRPDRYRVSAEFTTLDKEPITVSETFPVSIVPRKLPNEFPVLMWGGGLTEIERLKKIGFTHALGIGTNHGSIWAAGKSVPVDTPARIQETRQQLDAGLAAGLTFAASSYPGSYLRSNSKYQRVGRDGKPYPGDRADICALNPEVRDFAYNTGISLAQSYGDLPSFGAALLHTEVRGHARPCFHPRDHDAFKRASGLAIPPEVVHQRGVDYRKIKDFPKNRVIPDDDEIYAYYRWLWNAGDGWNGLNTVLNRGLKTSGRSDFWTWYDPAVRVGSVFGSGGDVDVISQWTYSYPDPIRIGLATDELLAMAAGAEPRQDVMKMTQIIWYRSQTAPESKPGEPHPVHRAAWEREQPDAPFITIPPMQLREAFWTKIARPIKGIMYHGWGSLVSSKSPGQYRFTHPETQHELERLIRTVIRPLGPTLRSIPGVKSDIAFYESFAAQVYAKRGTYGWCGGWIGDSYHVAMWAGLQPEVVYDQTITTQGLDDYKMLFMTDCDVVTQSIVAKVRAFQSRGGIVIGDANITPAIKPDILINTYRRTGLAHQDKAELQARATLLREALTDRYVRYLDSSNPEVVTYRRRFVDTDYVFLTNDYREYGRYVGHHGRVMENGLPSTARIMLQRSSGFAYDLVTHQPVEFRQEEGQLVADIELGPGAGRMIMITPTVIDRVKLVAPQALNRSEQKTVTIEVVDSGGTAVDAVIPLEVRIEDAEGRLAERSGYWAALHGKLTIPLDIAPNDVEGVWQVRVSELASGRSAAAYFRVGEVPGNQPDTQIRDHNAGNAVQPNG